MLTTMRIATWTIWRPAHQRASERPQGVRRIRPIPLIRRTTSRTMPVMSPP